MESFTTAPSLPLDVNRLHIRECILHRGTDGERALPRILDSSERNMRLAGGAVIYVNHA